MRSSRFFVAALACAASTLAGAQGAATPQQQLQTRALAATCANCHGTDGHGAAGSTVPALAGLPAAEIADKLRGFKSGALPATVMHQLSKGYNDAQINQLAAYFAAQSR